MLTGLCPHLIKPAACSASSDVPTRGHLCLLAPHARRFVCVSEGFLAAMLE